MLSSKLTPWFLLLCLPIRLLLKKWHRLLTLKIGSGQVSSWISDRWLADMPKRTQLKEDHRPQKRTLRQLECKLKFQLFRLSATSLTTGSRRAYSNPVIKADEISWMTSWLDMASAYSKSDSSLKKRIWKRLFHPNLLSIMGFLRGSERGARICHSYWKATRSPMEIKSAGGAIRASKDYKVVCWQTNW